MAAALYSQSALPDRLLDVARRIAEQEAGDPSLATVRTTVTSRAAPWSTLTTASFSATSAFRIQRHRMLTISGSGWGLSTAIPCRRPSKRPGGPQRGEPWRMAALCGRQHRGARSRSTVPLAYRIRFIMQLNVH